MRGLPDTVVAKLSAWSAAWKLVVLTRFARFCFGLGTVNVFVSCDSRLNTTNKPEHPNQPVEPRLLASSTPKIKRCCNYAPTSCCALTMTVTMTHSEKSDIRQKTLKRYEPQILVKRHVQLAALLPRDVSRNGSAGHGHAYFFCCRTAAIFSATPKHSQYQLRSVVAYAILLVLGM